MERQFLRVKQELSFKYFSDQLHVRGVFYKASELSHQSRALLLFFFRAVEHCPV
jgi:hypothetical protein